MYEPIKYEPSQEDLDNIKKIEDFFNEEGIPYEKDKDYFGIFYLNDRSIEIRYINSYYHPMDNEKRFGKERKGIVHDYFIHISHDNYEKGIRTIWIFDFEMSQSNRIMIDGKEVEYHRQWEVIKNTLRTCTGHIHHRFFARDCEVREVGNKELRPFLETNCFYGYRSANKNLGLYLKKDKNGYKEGTLLMVFTFGYNFYGNKKRPDDPFIEIIRVSTVLGCQVIGGMSKCLKHFLLEYPKLSIGGKEVKVKELRFYVDSSHNDGRGMQASGLGFNFISWAGAGFMNRWTVDYDDGTLKGKRGEIFHRKPMFHKLIMQLIGEGKIVSIANAGTGVYSITRKEYLSRFSDDPKVQKALAEIEKEEKEEEEKKRKEKESESNVLD